MSVSGDRGSVQPGELPSFCRTPDEIKRLMAETLDGARAVIREVIAETRPTFSSVVARIAYAENEVDAAASLCTLLKEVSPDPAVRAAAVAAARDSDEYSFECLCDPGLYTAIRAVSQNEAEMAALDDEDRYLVWRLENSLKRFGLELPLDEQQHLHAVERQLHAATETFVENIRTSQGAAPFTRSELCGLPDEFFAARAPDTGAEGGPPVYTLSCRTADYMLVLKFAASEAARKKMFMLNCARCAPQNAALLAEIVRLRRTKARMLGYDSFADYALENMMAGSVGAVRAMLRDFVRGLAATAEAELETLRAMKRADAEAAGARYDGFFRWDLYYYARALTAGRHQIDGSDVQQYFPMERTVRGVLDVFQELLGLEIARVEGASVWSEDVRVYRVREAGSGELVGHFYHDPLACPGKSTVSAVALLRAGWQWRDGTRQTPVAVMRTSFDGESLLLRHAHVVTLMHELGHVFHKLCARTRWGTTHSVGAARDFVEVPSKLFENWAWEPRVLRRIARHHATGAPMPEPMLRALLAARGEGVAMATVDSAMRALFDLDVHAAADESVDPSALYREMAAAIAGHDYGDARDTEAVLFQHIARGYASCYYSYLWSQSLSADMFATRFKRDGIFNTRTARHYRDEILRPGGSRDPSAGLLGFLGRAPSNAAFLKVADRQTEPCPYCEAMFKVKDMSPHIRACAAGRPKQPPIARPDPRRIPPSPPTNATPAAPPEPTTLWAYIARKMITLVSGAYRYLTRQDEFNVLLLGLDGAGKTTLLERVKQQETGVAGMAPDKIQPTVGVNIAKVQRQRRMIRFLDLGGQKDLRGIWDAYYADSHAVLFAVDAGDRARMEEARGVLLGLARHGELRGLPMLVLATKQDTGDVSALLATKEMVNSIADALDGRDVRVLAASGLSGDGLPDAIDWLLARMLENSHARPPATSGH
ncbi:metalloendopeptidase [Coemansia javaensis]|uniref:Metalloendopeptidase n=1 Tax=Coemansia javaensis TaxID=2761396 RepID=A0A9W8LFT3_9FUNG|nr:metalloendopeptidase [Coemansia javaensis]